MSDEQQNELNPEDSTPESEPTPEAETTVSDASDAREPGDLSDELEEVLAAIDEPADVTQDDRRKAAQRNMSGNMRSKNQRKYG
jgi:hypothetical protein